eukprot:5264572-Lingulodinium_polyedra.AAC.1
MAVAVQLQRVMTPWCEKMPGCAAADGTAAGLPAGSPSGATATACSPPVREHGPGEVAARRMGPPPCGTASGPGAA